PERLQIDRGTQRSTDEPLDLERPSAGPPRDALALAALGRTPGQHRVLGRDPPGALAVEEFRHALLKGRETEDLRVPERDLGRPFCEFRHADVDGDRA